MKTLLFVIWFVSFIFTIMTVENLNCAFFISLVVLGVTTYKIKKERYDLNIKEYDDNF